MIREIKEGIAERVIWILEWIGIDPLYAVTIFVILIAFSYRKDFERWKKIPFWEKGIIVSTYIGAFVFSIMSLLQIFGILKW